MMKYLRRALKYFLQITLISTVIIAVLMLAGVLSRDINIVFQKGWTSVGYILLMFLGVAAVYPRFGYAARILAVPGEYAELRGGIVRFMENRGYVLEKEEGENLSFRLSSATGRLARFLEDRITFTRVLGGFEVEGLNRDIVRIINGLQYKYGDR